VILRGLDKEQKKEIYFWNKAKIFSSFLVILTHVLCRSLKEAFDESLCQLQYKFGALPLL